MSSMQSTVLISYFILCCVLGFFRIPAVRSFKDYALGSIQFSTLVLSTSMVAALVDTEITVGMVGRSADDGISYILPIVGIFVRWWVFATCLSKSFSLIKENNCMSLVDIMSLFYGKAARICTTLGVVLFFFWLGILYKMAGIILETFVNIPCLHGTLIVAGIVTFYSIFGGINAVIVTDVMQFVIFITILPIVIIIGLTNIDLGGIIENIPQEKLTIDMSNLAVPLSLLLYNMVPSTGFETVQRAIMCRDTKQLKAVCRYTCYTIICFATGMCLVGLLSSGLESRPEGDRTIFAFIEYAVPKTLIPFVAIGFLAVIMSTTSSYLNSMGVIITKNVFMSLFPSLQDQKKADFLKRTVGFFITAIALLTTLIDKQMIELFFMLNSFWDPIITLPFIMGLIGYKVAPNQFKYIVINSITATCIAMYILEPGSIIVWSISVGASFFTIVFLNTKSKIYGQKAAIS